MTIFDDIGKGIKNVGEDIFVKPVNNIGKGVKDAGGWFVHAGEDIYSEVKKGGSTLLNWSGDRFDSIFNNPMLWIIAGVIVVVVILK